MRILTARWPGLASYWSVSGVHELSVNHDQMNFSYHSGSLLVELRVPPPPSSLLPYSANVTLTARLSALAVRKITSQSPSLLELLWPYVKPWYMHFSPVTTKCNILLCCIAQSYLVNRISVWIIGNKTAIDWPSECTTLNSFSSKLSIISPIYPLYNPCKRVLELDVSKW